MKELFHEMVKELADQLDPELWEAVWPKLERQVFDAVGELRQEFHKEITNQFQFTIYGQSEIPRLAFCDYARKLGAEYPSDLDGLLNAMLECQNLGWWWPFQKVCVVSERPSELHFDNDQQLHCEDGPAISYPDGWSLYFWHGRRVPEWVVENPTPELIAKETNVEIRRCGIESLGWDRYVVDARLNLVGSAPDPGNPGQRIYLYDVPQDIWGDPVRLILVTNGSPERDGTRNRFGLTVPQEMSDPVSAAAWGYGETREEYLETARRT